MREPVLASPGRAVTRPPQDHAVRLHQAHGLTAVPLGADLLDTCFASRLLADYDKAITRLVVLVFRKRYGHSPQMSRTAAIEGAG